jgi:hypothetical protein
MDDTFQTMIGAIDTGSCLFNSGLWHREDISILNYLFEVTENFRFAGKSFSTMNRER